MGGNQSSAGSRHSGSNESDPEYWRGLGDGYAEQRNQAYAASKQAYQRRDHAEAKRLSGVGQDLDRKAKEAQKRASDMYFAANNAGKADDEIDLHGLRVEEAKERAEAAIKRAKANGVKKLVFIVGKGLHSEGGVPKIKPAILSLINKHNLRCTPNVPNPGCITVELVKPEERGWVGRLFAAVGCVIS